MDLCLASCGLSSQLIVIVAGEYSVVIVEETIACVCIVVDGPVNGCVSFPRILVECIVERLNSGELQSGLLHSGLQSVVSNELALVDHLSVSGESNVDLTEAVLECVVVLLKCIVCILELLIHGCSGCSEYAVRSTYVILVLLLLVSSCDPLACFLTYINESIVVSCEQTSVSSLLSEVIGLLKQISNLCLGVLSSNQIILVRQSVAQVSVYNSPLSCGTLSGALNELASCVAEVVDVVLCNVSKLGLVALDVELSKLKSCSKVNVLDLCGLALCGLDSVSCELNVVLEDPLADLITIGISALVLNIVGQTVLGVLLLNECISRICFLLDVSNAVNDGLSCLNNFLSRTSSIPRN